MWVQIESLTRAVTYRLRKPGRDVGELDTSYPFWGFATNVVEPAAARTWRPVADPSNLRPDKIWHRAAALAAGMASGTVAVKITGGAFSINGLARRNNISSAKGRATEPTLDDQHRRRAPLVYWKTLTGKPLRDN
jgi:hypothetical protein